MILRKNRATKNNLDKIWRKGQSLFSGNLTLRFIRTPDPFPPRIAFIVPKTAGNAVQRNALRRRGYAAIFPHISSLPQGFVGALIYNPKKEDERNFNYLNKLVSKILKDPL